MSVSESVRYRIIYVKFWIGSSYNTKIKNVEKKGAVLQFVLFFSCPLHDAQGKKKVGEKKSYGTGDTAGRSCACAIHLFSRRLQLGTE